MRRVSFGPWRLLLPLLLVAAAGAVIVHTRQFDADQGRLQSALEASRAAAARLATARAAATQPSEQTFQALQAVALLVPALTGRLEDVPSRRALTLAAPSTDALVAAWREAGAAAERVVELSAGVLALERDAERLQSVATGLLVTSDELMDALLGAEAKPAQLRAASRQLLLVQRISTNLRRLMDAGAGLLAAADRLGRDAVAFGEVATGLLSGSEELGLERVEDGEAREILAAVGREFRVLAQAVEEVMAGAAARVALGRRLDALARAQTRVEVLNDRLAGALETRAGERLLTPLAAQQLAVLAALSLLVALVLGLAEHRAAARRQRREREAAADERVALEAARDRLGRDIEQLAADVHRIADGDLGLRAHTHGGEVAAVGVARAGLDRLRQQLDERVQDGMHLARSGQLVGEVAQRLRDSARRHAQQAEQAGQATRIMAAALEALRAESGQVTEAARRCGASSGSAGAALGETLHELDAVRAGVEDCAERVRALEDVARELRAVRTLVEDVGELGKMLSLNVAIQASVDSAASRALSAFSEEVQRLANRARGAVSQVEAIHGELRAEAERAAAAVKESVWRARSAAERARGARGAVDELAGAARRLEDLNHGLGRAQREHAVNVTEVVRAVTALHALSREVREQVEATVESAAAFGEAAAGAERRLAAPARASDDVIDLTAAPGGTPSGPRQETGARLRALGRWT